MQVSAPNREKYSPVAPDDRYTLPCSPTLKDMRDREDIDSELRRLAAELRSNRERGGNVTETVDGD